VSEDDDLDQPQPPPPRRGGFRRFLKRLAIVVGVVAVVWVVARWQIARVGERRLNAAVDRIEVAEPDWKFDAIEAQRQRHAPPPEQNSAPLVDAVVAGVPDEWDKWRQNATWLPDVGGKGESNHLPRPERVKEFRTHAEATVAIRELAHTLRDRPRGHRRYDLPDNPIAMTLPHLDTSSKVTTLLHYDAIIASLDSNPNRAVRAAHAALNVSRSIGDEPMLISQLFRMSIRNRASHITLQTLAWGTPTDGLAELQAAFLADADEPLFLHGVRGERAALHKLFLGLESGTVHYDSIIPACNRPPWARELLYTYRPLLYADHAEFLRIMTAYVQAAKLPWHEQRDAMRAVLPDGPPGGMDRVVTRLLLPACDKVADGGLRSRAKLLTTGLAIACERFRRQHGRWPKTLQELPTSLVAAIPVSPFDGRPIRYQVLADGIAISCFCHSNMNIDGPAEFREGDAKGFAEGARLWTPEHRGLPALAEKEKDDP
jgi:hypothetical protein